MCWSSLGLTHLGCRCFDPVAHGDVQGSQQGSDDHLQVVDDQHVFPIVEIYDGTDSFTAHRESDHFAEIDGPQSIPLL